MLSQASSSIQLCLSINQNPTADKRMLNSSLSLTNMTPSGSSKRLVRFSHLPTRRYIHLLNTVHHRSSLFRPGGRHGSNRVMDRLPCKEIIKEASALPHATGSHLPTVANRGCLEILRLSEHLCAICGVTSARAKGVT
ncbi:unnamed protein product [Protopolystoma xenopodis]|uniref:Uncharacterized protein n=1 Tax=Protopolystoma xenopodis TaxID=117903 RepID=A0A3S5C5P4_9PLAT|nr:unnamed protein product [Protopolystoma xenopodis]